MPEALPEVAHELGKRISGEVQIDAASRALYSTDASIYQIEPLGVVFPRTAEELLAAVEILSSHNVPILPRGSGSSLAGQAVGAAFVVDCSRYLNKTVEINAEARTAVVEPGVVLGEFNQAAARAGLQYGPDPASADRATFGGMLGNNSTGAHSISYGMTADNVIAVDAVLADGAPVTFENLPEEEAQRRAGMDTAEGRLYRAALEIRRDHADEIQSRWPQTWRRSTGYSLNYLLPWSATRPPQWPASQPYPPGEAGSINLAPLLAGSEGTLAVFRRATVNLVPLPRKTVLGVLSFGSVAEACDVTPELLRFKPSAVELIPRALIRQARNVPAYANQLWFVKGDPEALLVVEFSGEDADALAKQVNALGKDIVIAESKPAQEQIWSVRKVGLGLLMSRPGDTKPLPFIEDVAVPVERLGDFVRGFERIMAEYGTTGDFYAHASAGCLHIRPLINLKTAEGFRDLRRMSAEVVDLSLELGGALSGEHGDGLARGEWLERVYGPNLVAAFARLKQAADSNNLLNPGKKIDAPPMDENLRYTPDYRARAWQPEFDFSKQGDLMGTVEMCNGAGVCRKSGGVMCPSFQATRDEMHSTRGRANLLRVMMAGHMPQGGDAERAAHAALDLCLECKGCKAECPSGVDMAKLKYEFLNHYYRSHRRPLRDYLFGYLGAVSRLGRPLAPVGNWLLSNRIVRRFAERLFGISARRALPRLQGRGVVGPDSSPASTGSPVMLLIDPFTEYFYPEIGRQAVAVLEQAGCRVFVLPVVGAGRTLISKGFLRPARRHAEKLLEAVGKIDPDGTMPLIGVEPSEVYALKDEYLDFFPNDDVVTYLARRTYLLEEFLLRPLPDNGGIPVENLSNRQTGNRGKALHVHGHCYQKAQPPAADGYPTGVAATLSALKGLGFAPQLIESGCCGMAGSFGYETAHYDVSMQIGELHLFPAVRNIAEDAIIVAPGVSCRAQIENGAGRQPLHPVSLIAQTLNGKPS